MSLKKYRKLIILLLVVLPLSYFVFLGYRYYWKPDKNSKIKTAVVKRGDISIVVAANGSVEPETKVEVKSKASGEIIHFPFEEGDSVKKGELLLKIDKSDDERNVRREEANILTLKARLGQAKASLELQKIEYETSTRNIKADMDYAIVNYEDAETRLKRKKELFNEKLIARESIDEAQTAFELTKAKLEQAKARTESLKGMEQNIKIKQNEIELVEGEIKKAEISLEQAKERLKDTEVVAPISGIIIEKKVEKGQIISSGISTVTGGTHLSTIADMNRIFVVADVDETDIGKIRPMLEAKIATDAYPDNVFYGRVDRIAPIGLEENKIIIFKVKIEVTGKDREILKPSMTANVRILIETREGVVMVPDEAIKEEGGNYLVYIMKSNNFEARKVKRGISDGLYTEIIEGLVEGEIVVTSGLSGDKLGIFGSVSRNPTRGMRMMKK